MTEIREEIRQYILSEFLPGERPSNLKDDTPLQSSGIVDSMGVLLLVRFVEEKLGIEIGAQELRTDDFTSIDNIASFVVRRTTAQS